MKRVSILVPCFNESASLPKLFDSLSSIMDQYNQYQWELLMVNDGSSDDTINVIRSYKESDSRIAYVDLSRNFGKERALLAGFDYATGDCVIIMDADLQHPPKAIPEMLSWWEQGYEDVYAKRIIRGRESIIRKWSSLLYYKILSKLVDNNNVLQNVGDFRLLDRKCINALTHLRESERYTKGMYSWIGFRKKEILFEQGDRVAGKSSFTFSKLFSLAIDGITSFSTVPLRLSVVFGIVISLAALVYMCVVIGKTLILGDPVKGYPTLVVIILFLGGIQLLSLGIIGEYIGKIFKESKGRPVYIVREYKP